MANPTLSTGISRRTILGGSALIPAATFPLLTTLAAPPEAAIRGLDLSADSELFRRISAAGQLRSKHAQAQRLCYRLHKVSEARNDPQSLPFRTSHPTTWHQCVETFERYAVAVRSALVIPARTVSGVHAKLSLGMIAARRGGARVYMYEDRAWLEVALADLKRLAHDVPTTK